MSLADRQRGSWLVSAPYDIALVALPLIIAFGSLALLPDDGFGKPLWAYVAFIVSFDVAHVWSTGYLTYFDRRAFSRRRRLLTLLAPACAIASFALHMVSSTLFWTVLAYVAIFHFTKQQFGFIALYKARRREWDPIDFRLDKLALWTGALGPVALWHADPAEVFDWFDSGEQFALRLPAASMPWIYGIMALVAVAWIGRQVGRALAGHAPSAGKCMWMIASWVTWFLGVRVAANFFVAAAFLNLFHGIPYLGLVWHRVRANPENRERDRGIIARVLRPGGWILFYGVIFALALGEEALWDRFVWGDFVGLYVPRGAALEAVFASLVVALLSLPQVVHYALDALLWKMSDANRDFRAAFSL